MEVDVYIAIVNHTLLEDPGSRLHASLCLKSSPLWQKLTAFSVKLLPQSALS